jgi:TolB protein
MEKIKMKRFSPVPVTLFLVTLFLFSTTGHARVYYDITATSFKKVTIGVPPFKGEGPGKLRSDTTDLLNKDLDLSGFFITTPQSLMDKELTDEGIEKGDIRFGNWRSIGIELLCKARVQEKDGDLTLEAYLYDTLDGSLMLAKRYRTRADDWRRAVHRLADDIMLAVTGEKGINSSRVVFVSGTRNRKEIYMSDIDGTNPKSMTNFRSITLSPSVSPNGKYLAYTSYREGKPNLYVTDLEQHKEVYADREEGMKTGTAWTGKSTLVYSHTSGRYSSIYSFDVERKDRKVIQRNEGIATSPALSPDGTKMVFVSDMHGSPQVFMKDLASGSTNRLTFSGTYNSAPVFSPKGDAIAFVARFEGAFEICLMNVDGTNQRVLTSGGINDSPQFSPCGRYIIYSSNRGGKHGIYVMLFNGENKRLLKFTDGEESQPKFVP